MDHCIFCAILAGTEPVSYVYEGERVVAFMDILPVTPGHLLVIPRAHHAWLHDVDADDAAEMMRVAQALGGSLRRTDLRVDGVNLFLADGEEAGQEVFHTHLHVIPRWPGDGFHLEVDYDPAPSRAELDRLAELIRVAS